MTIRTRLALWYTGVLSASLILLSALVYNELVVEPRECAAHGDGPRRAANVEEGPFEELVQLTLSCGIPAALLGLLGGWLLLRQALGPIRAMTEAADRMHEGNLDCRLPVSGNGDEIDRLSRVFNEMTLRLDSAFRRLHEFTLNASHELKTPLTVLRGELEGALRNDNLTPAQMERVAGEIDEVQRLAHIVDGLTFLTKAGAGQVAFARQRLRLDELVRDAYEDALVLAQPQSVTVTLAACEETWISGDRHRLRQLLLNLTDNAVKYNRPDGSVALAVRRRPRDVCLTIANTGPGIAPENQDQILQPFFRGDTSHGNHVEGCGLGLSICKLIAKHHGARLAFSSEPGSLTEFTVTFPPVRPPADRQADDPEFSA